MYLCVILDLYCRRVCCRPGSEESYESITCQCGNLMVSKYHLTTTPLFAPVANNVR